MIGVVGFGGLLNAKRLQPWSKGVDIGEGETEFNDNGIPIFSRGPHCKWTSALGWLALINKIIDYLKRKLVIEIQTFINNPKSSTYSWCSTIKINI